MSKESWFAVVLACVATYAPAASAASFQTVYTFKGGTDFTDPESPPTFYKGLLYGLARSGGGTNCRGHQGCGGFYVVNPATGAETILRHYKPSPQIGLGAYPVGSVQLYKGQFYTGFAYYGLYGDGYVARLSPTGYGHIIYGFDTGVPTLASLVLDGQVFYGSASPQQDIGKPGMLFELVPSTGAITILYTLPGGDGTFTMSAPVIVGETLYSTAGYNSGKHRQGYLLSYDMTTGVATDLYDFKGDADGNNPTSLVVFKGRLYGVSQATTLSPPNTCGTIFSFDLTNNKLRVLHQFSGDDGCAPVSLVALGDVLYGASSSGSTSASQYGTVFSIDPKSGAETVLHSFTGGTDGQHPNGLTVGSGALYGVTFTTVFSVTP